MKAKLLVLCKKTRFPFKAGKWYEATLGNDKPQPDSYWIDSGKTLAGGGRLYLTKVPDGLDPTCIFSDYFYTEQELRKEKLKNIFQ